MNTGLVRIDGGKVRLSNDELHRRASKAIYESSHVVFDSLPSLIGQIIENKVWEGYNHSSFADYALDAGSNGLGINSNQRLWLLRCALDIHGEHVKEWADVLVRVEEMVRITSGQTIRSLDGNSLRTLATDVGNVTHADAKITYLPSRAGNSSDGALLRLRKNHPETFQRVLNQEMTPRQGMIAARKADGENVARHQTNPGRAQSAFGRMTEEEREQFLDWLPEQLSPEERKRLRDILKD